MQLKRLFIIATLLLALAGPSCAQTKLIFVGHWDNGAALSGTVSLSQPVLNSNDIIVASKPLSIYGRVTFTTTLSPNSLYKITVTLADGTTLGPFLFTTIGLDLPHLTSGQVTATFRLADMSISKQVVTLIMNF